MPFTMLPKPPPTAWPHFNESLAQRHCDARHPWQVVLALAWSVSRLGSSSGVSCVSMAGMYIWSDACKRCMVLGSAFTQPGVWKAHLEWWYQSSRLLQMLLAPRMSRHLAEQVSFGDTLPRLNWQ